MPPVKGSATAGTGRRTHSPNPRLRFRLPAAGFVGPWPTGVCAGQPASACHAGRNARSQLGDIRAAGDLRRSRRSWNPHESPGGPVLGVSRRTLVDAGV
jgi:hypothetical protein